MSSPFKISLQIPNYKHEDRFFSFRLQETQNNEPSEFKEAEKLFVVSDIEGNFVQFYKLLVRAGVVSPTLQWIFGEGHLVILGDCFDRGDQVTECLWLIYSLEEKAKRVGGYVHFILGNHEVMNMSGDWRYVHQRYAPDSHATGTGPSALYYANDELWKWLRTKNIIEKVGPFLFVHAGISREILDLKLSISELNDLARLYYQTALDDANTTSLARLLIDSDYSPLWYRGYYEGSADKELIKDTLRHFKCYVIITGHTIQETITPYFSKRVFNVDTDHANNLSEGLLMAKNKFYRITIDGRKEKIE